jgi:hypothetical protein
VVGEPDVHLARSDGEGWGGPWTRLGAILRHEDVAWHNQRGDKAYEWGLEGGQLLELPNGNIVLNGVSFRSDGPAGARQRVFLAVAQRPTGPYSLQGPAIAPENGDDGGENGHATAICVDDELVLFFQEREVHDGRWRYALAAASLERPGAQPDGKAA